MSEIKRGDLVQIIKPSECCGNDRSVGQIFKVASVGRKLVICDCWDISVLQIQCLDASDGCYVIPSRLRRIDPPATGEYDGVPVRRKQPVKVTA